ncbi:MAG: hypothetical protein R3Y47_10535 [Lachnospiraceae bacterium]
MVKKDEVPCIPDGVWEATKPVPEKKHKEDITTDIQGNGYPIPHRSSVKDL